MVRPVGRGLDPSAGDCPGDGRWRKASRVAARGRAPTRASAGRRGRRPLRFARERAAAGACPSSGPAGPPSPKGEGKGCRGGIHPSRGVGGDGRSRRGGGTPPYGWGYGNAAGFTRAPVPGASRGRGRALRGCERGATVERSETGERTMFAPAGQTTARAGQLCWLAALVARRQAPRTPAVGMGCA